MSRRYALSYAPSAHSPPLNHTLSPSPMPQCPVAVFVGAVRRPSFNSLPRRRATQPLSSHWRSFGSRRPERSRSLRLPCSCSWLAAFVGHHALMFVRARLRNVQQFGDFTRLLSTAESSEDLRVPRASLLHKRCHRLRALRHTDAPRSGEPERHSSAGSQTAKR